jgi:hypothetical protein
MGLSESKMGCTQTRTSNAKRELLYSQKRIRARQFLGTFGKMRRDLAITHCEIVLYSKSK